MQSEREPDYTPPPYVKVRTIKIIPSKSLTSPKYPSVSLSVTAVGTFSLNPSTVLPIIRVLAL